ncbi:MAG: hypothetical protein HC915_03590 [Anaerolineae bacterium]|nr:hypothetical protein [Anaerolineae bacterium]
MGYATPNLSTPSAQPIENLPEPDSLETLGEVPRQTSLLIGAGAVAIILLVAMGAILFSTVNEGDATGSPSERACILALEEALVGRLEPTDALAANLRFSAGTELEVLEALGSYYLVRSVDEPDAEGWVSQAGLSLPPGCSLED